MFSSEIKVEKWEFFFFYSHTPILHACHVSDGRSRSMICIIIFFYYIFFFSLFALLFMDFSSADISLWCDLILYSVTGIS